MKMRTFFAVTILLPVVFLSNSCLKKERPYPLPPQGDADVQEVDIGGDYAFQVFFSFTGGIIQSNRFDSWDIAFDTDVGQDELWMNGGKNILFFPTGQGDFHYDMPSAIPDKQWLYDDPAGTFGKSALGPLTPANHIGELIFVRDGKLDYKLKITEATPAYYKIEVGGKEDAQGREVILERDARYNFVYYSFKDGIVQPEPEKTEWDMVFTRYRHIFIGMNADGSDMPYLVNGALLNSYKTSGAADSTREFEFNNFGMDEAATFTLNEHRDAIGYNWKLANINNGEYTVLPKRIFLLKDQQDQLWKFHFVSFYDEKGQRGKPKFEFKRLQ